MIQKNNSFKIDFIVDKEYLATYTIQNSNEENFVKTSVISSKNILLFQNTAWEKSKYIYRIIVGKNPLNLNYYNSFTELGADLDKYLEDITSSESFKEILAETNQTIEKLILEWEQNFQVTEEYITKLGLQVQQDFKIKVVHPCLKAGSYHGNGLITWGYRSDFPNYNTIYIWHEILHSIFENSDLNHALIELITDNEMRKILNGDKYPPFTGHPSLNTLKEGINPKFQELIKTPNCNILQATF